MTSFQQPDFEKEFNSLCKRYDVVMFAGFYISRTEGHSVNSVTVVAPWVKEIKSTQASIHRIMTQLERVMSRETPLPRGFE